MTTAGAPLDDTLRALALTLAEATDAGWSLSDLRAVVLDDDAGAGDPDLVTDVILAAHGFLVGLWPPDGLTGVWGSARVSAAAVAAARVVGRLVGPS